MTIKRAFVTVLAIATAFVMPALALAQQTGYGRTGYEEAATGSVAPMPFLVGAYAFIWVAVLAYVALVARRLSRVQAEIEELRGRIERDARS